MAMIIRKKKILFMILTSCLAIVLLSSRVVTIETAIGMMATLKSKFTMDARCSFRICMSFCIKDKPFTDYSRASKSGTNFLSRMTGVTRMTQTIMRTASRNQDFKEDL